jgi:hypothetical protein
VLAGKSQRYETDYELKHDGLREWYTIRVESLERADGGAVVTRANISTRRQAQAEIEEQRRQHALLSRVADIQQPTVDARLDRPEQTELDRQDDHPSPIPKAGCQSLA